MSTIKIEVKEHEDEQLATYTYHVSTDDKSLWIHGEINIKTNNLEIVRNKEELIEKYIQNLVDDLYAYI